MLKEIYSRCFCLPVLFVIVSMILCGKVFAQSEIIISQYIESTSGFEPNGIEVFNISGADINFATRNLLIFQGINGAACNPVVTVNSGILAADEVWVIGSADVVNFAIANGQNLSGTKNYYLIYTGNDAITVQLGGVIQDMFGTCGNDPGIAWSGSGVSTADQNIEIKNGVCDGDINGWTDPSIRFKYVAAGQALTGFGNAPISCNGATTVVFSSEIYTQSENGTSIDLCLGIINPDAANATSAQVKLISGAADLGNYTTQTVTFPAGSTAQQCVTITITDNDDCDGNRDYSFELQNVSGGNSAVAGNVHSAVLTITDDDSFSENIFVQDFDGTTPVWNYSGGGSNSPSFGKTGNGREIKGTESFQLSSVPTTGFSNMLLTIKNSAPGQGIPFGVEGADALKVYVNLNGTGFPVTPDIKIQPSVGTYDTAWPYSASGIASTTAGTPATYFGDAASGYATIKISIPDGTTSVGVKIQSANNEVWENYFIDDITLFGMDCNPPCVEPTVDPEFHSNTPTFVTGTTATFKWFSGNGTNRLMVLKEGAAVTATPVDGITYPANAAFGSGYSFGPNEYAVYNGPGNQVDLTNLTPGTEYFAKIFEYNCLPGNEDYYTSGTPDTDVFITPPENPATFTKNCIGPTSIDLTWTPPANGNFDGYLLVVREGTNPPVAVTSLNPSSQVFNSNYSTAPTYGGSTPVSKVVYRGTATSITITSLIADGNYTFKLYTYVNGTSGWKYSTGTTTNQTITLAEVTNLSTTPHANTIDFSWNINASCIDEIMLAASDVGGVTSIPTGTGYNVSSNSFTDPANPTLSPGGEKVVYSNIGTTVTVTGLTTNQEYCFKVFVRKGAAWSQGVDICETPRNATVLEPGDISIVAINTDTDDNVNKSPDEICFVSYKSITAGTSIDFTDNGYERLYAGKWGDTEGVIRITRKLTAPTIQAGQVICIEGYGHLPSAFTIYTCGVEDTDWVVSSLNGVKDLNFDLNKQDQVWIMQNGNWIPDPVTSQKATYTGNVLYGWTATGWKTNIGNTSPIWTTAGSRLYPNSSCLSANLNSIGANNDKVKYTGSFTAKNRIEWIQSFNDYTNWTGFATNTNYFSTPPLYNQTCIQITILPLITIPGLWTGNADTDWFNCENWDNLQIPDHSINAIIRNGSTDPIINGPGAACYDLILETGGKLTLNNLTSELNIFGNLSVEGTLTNTAGTIVIAGDSDQNITDSLAAVNTITFKNLTINKPNGVLTSDEDISIYGNALFTKGLLIPTADALVSFQSGATTSGATNASFVNGRVRKIASTGTNFTFPIGDTSGDTIGWYQPARIFGNSEPATIDAQYFAEAHPEAGPYYNGNSNSTTDNREIGNCDFWTVKKVSGSDVKLALKYENTDDDYCNILGDAAAIRIFSFNPDPLSMEWSEVFSGNIGDEIVGISFISIQPTGGIYGDFAFGGASSGGLNVLPIQLTTFTAKPENQKVRTAWITETETNNAFFTVERSADARIFQEIGKVTGAGTSHTPRDYAFTDQKPLSGLSYYRLKQTDFDGHSAHSDIVAVSFTETDGFSLDLTYRDDNELNLVYNSISPYILVEIFDVLGKRVYTEVVENYGGRSVLNPNLGRGAYVVRISAGDKWDSGKIVW